MTTTRIKQAATTLALAASGVVAAVALTGTTDASAGSRPSVAVTKASFIAEADAVCDRYSDRLEAITPNSDPAAPGKPLVHLARIAYAWHGLEADMERELRAITPPAEFAARWKVAMDGLTDRVAAELVVGDDAVANDRQAIRTDGLKMMKAGARSVNALHGYGFKRCGVLR